jgi:ligand-binding sensor domain-containing protein/signal transduction histidine kinase
MKTKKHISKNIFRVSNIMGMMVLFMVVLFFYSSCINKPKSNSGQSQTSKITKVNIPIPPVSVVITNPTTILLDTCPRPQHIKIPTTNQTIRLKNGALLKLVPPVTKPADFLSIMQNYTADNGLTIDAISCAIMDKSGNLWFGTYGGGVSRYDGKSFTKFTSAQGLAGNVVCSITEDKMGNIWFGTERGGVSRYDGKSFTTYTTEQGLASNIVLSIMQDRKGYLWFGTGGGGISRYDPNQMDAINKNEKFPSGKKQNLKRKNGKSIKYFTNLTTKQGLAENMVWSTLEDKKGNLWFGTDGGVSKYDGNRFVNFTPKEGLANNLVRCITEDKKGNIWIGTKEGGISRYDGKSFTNFTTEQGLANNSVCCITEDKRGNLWFGTEGGGVSRYDGNSFINFTTKQGLANNTVRSITEDQTGNLWLGTDGGGVSCYNGRSFTNFTITQGLANNSVWNITEDKLGNLWFGTDGSGISLYNGKSFTNFTTAQGLASNTVWSIIEDKIGNLWFGTDHSGVSRYDGKYFTNLTSAQGLANDRVVTIKEDKNGNLWFGTYGGGVSRYDGKSFTNFTTEQGLVSNNVRSIMEDKMENLWFCTSGGGVSRYNGKSFTNYTTAQGLGSNMVFDITEDKKGNIWLATSEGLSRYDGKSFNNFTAAQGLPDNVITQVIITKEENIALGTNSGIAVLTSFTPKSQDKNIRSITPAQNNLNNKELKNYTPVFEIYNMATGYPIKDVNSSQNTMYEDHNGIIWIATGSDKTGVVRFDYASLNKNPQPPKMFIQSIKINNENICWHDLLPSDSHRDFSNEKTDSITTPKNITEEVTSFGRILSNEERESMFQKFGDLQFDGITKFYPIPENLVLPYKNNNLTFDFAAIEPAKPYLLRYRYLLEGYDNDWSPITTKTTATFGNIYEGTYTFKVKAQFTGLNAKGAEEWSEPITYTFKVLPPWWRTWWMYGIDTIAVFILLFGIYHWRTASHRKDKERLEQTVTVRTKELQKSAEELEATNKELEAFSYSVSHDLRAPLRAIIGYSKILEEDCASKLDADEMNSLNAIGNNSKKMNELIDDLLAFSKLGRTEMTTSEINMNALVESVREEEMMGISNEIEFTVNELLPSNGAQTLIRQVWVNLISNAIKFSEHKPKPSIEIGSYYKDNLVVYYVKDNGAGFDMQYYDKLFGVFQRLHSQEEFEGTGIGLAIVQKIVHRHNGTVWAESKLNEGACFYFSLPEIKF